VPAAEVEAIAAEAASAAAAAEVVFQLFYLAAIMLTFLHWQWEVEEVAAAVAAAGLEDQVDLAISATVYLIQDNWLAQTDWLQ
jgi:hypothetical protein